MHFHKSRVTSPNMNRYTGPLNDRFHKRYVVNPITGCWDWQGGAHSKGYGKISAEGRSLRASRVSWELHYPDKPIGELCVCHTCDRPICVNPEHLFLGTHKDNAHDAFQKGRRKSRVPKARKFRGFIGPKRPKGRPLRRDTCKHGHAMTEENTYRWKRKDGGENKMCRACITARNRAHAKLVSMAKAVLFG